MPNTKRKKSKKQKSNASNTTVLKKRIADDKKQFLELYEQSMSVVAAASKIGINRSTFYTWFHADKTFAKKFVLVRGDKGQYVRDQLDFLIATGNLRAIIFWLQHNAPEYANKLLVAPEGEWAEEAKEKRKLTEEQRTLIQAALKNIFNEPDKDSTKKPSTIKKGN